MCDPDSSLTVNNPAVWSSLKNVYYILYDYYRLFSAKTLCCVLCQLIELLLLFLSLECDSFLPADNSE